MAKNKGFLCYVVEDYEKLSAKNIDKIIKLSYTSCNRFVINSGKRQSGGSFYELIQSNPPGLCNSSLRDARYIGGIVA